MQGAFAFTRQSILIGLGLLLTADLGLAFYSWQASTAMHTPMAQLEADSKKLGMLSADIDRAEKIRHDLPATISDCDRFDGTLLPASSGDSAVIAELDDLAGKSGLQKQNLNFRHKEVAGRGLTQVDLDTTVSGSYAAIVKFMNNLQRSKNNYIVESLTLQQEGQSNASTLRIGLHLKTYYRTAA
jgi:Tfp pilus assembly protein PilO